MLKFRKPTAPVDAGSLADRPELRIRDLRDDPRLRRAMGLDTPSSSRSPRPLRRFDRRRLLDDTAA